MTVDVPARGITAVAGPSGAGKTTFLRLCNRLEVPTRGLVRYRGDDVGTLDPLVLRRRVGMVFQRAVLFGGSVRDNLHVATPGARDDALAAVLDAVGLDAGFVDREADTLSGGEAQRVCLARALLNGPEVLLLDEPTTGLDAGPTQAFERLVRSLAIPALWVTHDDAQRGRVADATIELRGGRVVG